LLLAVSGRAEVVDRMVAVVNKHVILESELDQTARVEFLLQGKPLDKLTHADLVDILGRLIDRSLLDQQIVNPTVLDLTPEELGDKMKEARDQVRGAATEEGWKAVLAGYGLTARDVEEHVAAQFRILRLIDLRFRGLVRVDKSAIEAYYREKLLPELHQRNAAEPQLAQVSGKIEKVLAEQRIDEMLNDWLRTLRAQAHIETMLPAAPASSAGSTP
jgi:hypothetical protein